MNHTLDTFNRIGAQQFLQMRANSKGFTNQARPYWLSLTAEALTARYSAGQQPLTDGSLAGVALDLATLAIEAGAPNRSTWRRTGLSLAFGAKFGPGELVATTAGPAIDWTTPGTKTVTVEGRNDGGASELVFTATMTFELTL